MVKRRSLWFTAPFQVEIREDMLPPLLPDEILVRTDISAISSGTEMLLYRGQMPENMILDETIAALDGTVTYPLKYGYAAIGKVIETGKDVDKSWNGRTVFAFQPHQSHFITRPQLVRQLPLGMEPDTAVFLPNMETAVSFVMDGRPVIGERVVVFGQGVVGLLTTMLLAQFPLAELIAVDGYALRRTWSTRLGATSALDPAEAISITGADLAYELSGNPAALNLAISAAGFDGRVIIGSWYGNKPAALELGGVFHRSHMRLISSQVSHLHPRWRGRWTNERRLDTAWQMLRQHDPAPLITHRFTLEDAADAYQLLDENAAAAVQLVLSYA
ncbi:MAG: zinc-dependent alcohol dehydrogenase [Candidatus Promineifilaceae bacterium]